MKAHGTKKQEEATEIGPTHKHNTQKDTRTHKHIHVHMHWEHDGCIGFVGLKGSQLITNAPNACIRQTGKEQNM